MALFLVVAALLVATQTPPAAAAGEPTVTRVSPTSGPLTAGQVVTITGTGFSTVAATGAVKFGAVASASYAVIDDKQIVAVVPAASAGGQVLVEVTNTNGANTTGAKYDYKAPSITKITPGWAKNDASSMVTITGTGFLGTVKADIKFGTAEALDVWVISDTQIVVKTPVDDQVSSPTIDVPNGVLDVVITRNSVASATDAKSKFLITPGLPTVTQIGDPSVVKGTDDAAVGTTLTIQGTQMWGVSKVSFGSTSVAPESVATDGTSVDVKVPARGNGPVDVVVENAAGKSLVNLNTGFSYYSTQAPTITSVYPNVLDKTTATKSTVLISGRGLTGVTASDVTLKCASDVTPDSATSISDTSLIIVVPGSNAAETCDVEVKNPTDGTKVTTKTDGVRYV
ncbi:MAG: IPT/TIG domain-containing protein [Acidimicrobiia bacterium]|nr:IPT/TIG domain-containing protein [Acidimicrobiia bacterium]